jgi:hypothetical protein
MIPTQQQIVVRLSELSRLLDAATVEIAELEESYVIAKQAFEVAQARAYLQSEGPVEARKAQAVVATAELALVMELAGARHRACRERIRTLGVQIDVGRSLGSAVRSQFAAETSGQWT